MVDPSNNRNDIEKFYDFLTKLELHLSISKGRRFKSVETKKYYKMNDLVKYLHDISKSSTPTYQQILKKTVKKLEVIDKNGTNKLNKIKFRIINNIIKIRQYFGNFLYKRRDVLDQIKLNFSKMECPVEESNEFKEKDSNKAIKNSRSLKNLEDLTSYKVDEEKVPEDEVSKRHALLNIYDNIINIAQFLNADELLNLIKSYKPDELNIDIKKQLYAILLEKSDHNVRGENLLKNIKNFAQHVKYLDLSNIIGLSKENLKSILIDCPHLAELSYNPLNIYELINDLKESIDHNDIILLERLQVICDNQLIRILKVGNNNKPIKFKDELHKLPKDFFISEIKRIGPFLEELDLKRNLFKEAFATRKSLDLSKEELKSILVSCPSLKNINYDPFKIYELISDLKESRESEDLILLDKMQLAFDQQFIRIVSGSIYEYGLIDRFKQIPHAYIINECLRLAPQFKEITLSDLDLNLDELKEIIEKCINLETLNISGTYIDDELISKIPRNLKELHIPRSYGFSDVGLGNMPPSLFTLRMGSSNSLVIRYYTQQGLSRLPTTLVNFISTEDDILSGECFKYLPRNLKSLKFVGDIRSSISMDQIKDLPSTLQSLDLSQRSLKNSLDVGNLPRNLKFLAISLDEKQMLHDSGLGWPTTLTCIKLKSYLSATLDKTIINLLPKSLSMLILDGHFDLEEAVFPLNLKELDLSNSLIDFVNYPIQFPKGLKLLKFPKLDSLWSVFGSNKFYSLLEMNIRESMGLHSTQIQIKGKLREDEDKEWLKSNNIQVIND